MLKSFLYLLNHILAYQNNYIIHNDNYLSNGYIELKLLLYNIWDWLML